MRACERERQTDREARLYLLRVASRRGASRRAGGVDERTATIGASRCCSRVLRAPPGRDEKSLTVCVHTCTHVYACTRATGRTWNSKLFVFIIWFTTYSAKHFRNRTFGPYCSKSFPNIPCGTRTRDFGVTWPTIWGMGTYINGYIAITPLVMCCAFGSIDREPSSISYVDISTTL